MNFSPQNLVVFASLWIALLVGVFPVESLGCTCNTASGFAPEGTGPEIYNTDVYGGFYSDFVGHTYCASHVMGVDMYTGCQGTAADLTPGTPTISADSTSLISNARTTIHWSCGSAGIANFFIQSGNYSQNNTISSQNQGSYDTGPLLQTTKYQVNCAANATSPWVNSSVTVNVDTSQTATDTTVQNFTSAVQATVNTKGIDNLGDSADGKQINSLASADEVAALGAGQAATIGAIFCAQGANANQADQAADAAAYYASCQQNFDAANGMNGKNGGFNPDPNILEGSAAKQSLEDFEKNFGVAPGDYLHKMLGERRGTASLPGMLDGKIPEAKLTEALEASRQLSPGDLSENANKFAVDLGGAKKPASMALRDALKKKLMDKSDTEKGGRLLASKAIQPGHADDSGPRFDNLAPLKEGIFAPDEGKEELSIFDVVHLAYQKLTPRMRPGRILAR